jgi:TolA-binding protein
MVIGTGVGWWATNLSSKVADLTSIAIERREQVANLREQIADIREKISEMETGHVAQNKALADLERQVYLLERGRR